VRSGDNVIIPHGSFPALVYPWFPLREEGVEVRLDLRSNLVDFAAFQPVKWIPSPSGLGLLYCREELLPALRTRHLGWTSAVRDGLEGLTDHTLPPWPTARRCDAGSVPPLQAISLETALGLLERVGFERIEERVLQLGAGLAGELRARGYRVRTPEARERRAGITSFEVREPEAVFERLRRDGIVVAVREGLLRASTHFYNDESEVERLLGSLPPP